MLVGGIRMGPLILASPPHELEEEGGRFIAPSFEITVDAGEGGSTELAELGIGACSKHRYFLRNGNSGEVTRFEDTGGLTV